MDDAPAQRLAVSIDVLDDLVHNARRMPLSDQRRLGRVVLQAAVEDISSALSAAGLEAQAGEPLARLQVAVEAARAVPLTAQVRVDPEALYGPLDELRERLAATP